MSRSNKADIERILKCRVNGKASCEKCDLSVECEKFKKFVRANSHYARTPDTHTARMMEFYT